jgi:hypothetical protein
MKPVQQAISLDFALSQARRLSGKHGWPFFDEGQNELARVLVRYARDEQHARDAITEICETWERCPAPNELRAELRPRFDIPAVTPSCRFGLCDGHGWIEVFSLETSKSLPNGAVFKEKSKITREQYNELSAKIDWEQQQVYSGVKPCQCRSDAPAPLISSRE